jgi:hypothetical protein
MAKSVLFAVLLAACSGSSKPATTPTSTPVSAAEDPTCPVSVAGTSVTAEDTANGAALVFVTTSDVGELRKRVAAMGKTHNDQHAAMGPLPTGNETGGGGHDHHDHAAMQAGSTPAPAGGGTMIDVHSKATAEDIERGAKLVFVAFPDGVAKIQSELRMHAQHLASGSCKMDHH